MAGDNRIKLSTKRITLVADDGVGSFPCGGLAESPWQTKADIEQVVAESIMRVAAEMNGEIEPRIEIQTENGGTELSSRYRIDIDGRTCSRYLTMDRGLSNRSCSEIITEVICCNRGAFISREDLTEITLFAEDELNENLEPQACILTGVRELIDEGFSLSEIRSAFKAFHEADSDYFLGEYIFYEHLGELRENRVEIHVGDEVFRILTGNDSSEEIPSDVGGWFFKKAGAGIIDLFGLPDPSLRLTSDSQLSGFRLSVQHHHMISSQYELDDYTQQRWVAARDQTETYDTSVIDDELRNWTIAWIVRCLIREYSSKASAYITLRQAEDLLLMAAKRQVGMVERLLYTLGVIPFLRLLKRLARDGIYPRSLPDFLSLLVEQCSLEHYAESGLGKTPGLLHPFRSRRLAGREIDEAKIHEALRSRLGIHLLFWAPLKLTEKLRYYEILIPRSEIEKPPKERFGSEFQARLVNEVDYYQRNHEFIDFVFFVLDDEWHASIRPFLSREFPELRLLAKREMSHLANYVSLGQVRVETTDYSEIIKKFA